jgi:RNA polymerase sigma-70 factor (ECF subfamily)
MDSKTSEQELIDRILHGEQRLFAVLVNRYQDMAFTLAFRLTGNREDAEELAQSAFVKAYTNLAGFRGQCRFSTWLYTIVQSLGLSFLRKKSIETLSLSHLSVEAKVASHADDAMIYAMENQSKKAVLQQAIAQLSHEDAAVLSLFYQAEQNLDEMGQILGIAANTAKVRLHRARTRLRKVLEKHFAPEVENMLNN